MSKNSDNFISEVFWTRDQMFAFQKVGRYYRLYDRDSDYTFLKEFTSFQAMQEFIKGARDDAEKSER